jgi:GNAT superfamily N-acetyltransferase
MREDDKNEVFSLMKECLEEEYNAENYKENIDSIINYYYSRKDSKVICLFVEDKLVGFMWTIESDDIITGEKFCFGLYLAVKKEFRGKKYSKLIYEETLKFCKKNKFKKFKFTVRKNNDIALNLHYDMGAKIDKYEMSIDID